MKFFKLLLDEIVEERPGYISKFLDQPPAVMRSDYLKKAKTVSKAKQTLINKRQKRKQFRDVDIQAVT